MTSLSGITLKFFDPKFMFVAFKETPVSDRKGAQPQVGSCTFSAAGPYASPPCEAPSGAAHSRCPPGPSTLPWEPRPSLAGVLSLRSSLPGSAQCCIRLVPGFTVRPSSSLLDHGLHPALSTFSLMGTMPL